MTHPQLWPLSSCACTGPNPTHQVNVHFFWIWLWLVHIAKLGARQVSLLVDCSQLDACLGRYGQGFARALLSEPVLLQGAAEPLVIDKLKFSVGGNWPFALHEYHQVIRPYLPCPTWQQSATRQDYSSSAGRLHALWQLPETAYSTAASMTRG